MEDTKDNLTIKFVVLGWYYDKYEELIDGLIEMKNGNPGIVDVFYSCHREPIDKVCAPKSPLVLSAKQCRERLQTFIGNPTSHHIFRSKII